MPPPYRIIDPLEVNTPLLATSSKLNRLSHTDPVTGKIKENSNPRSIKNSVVDPSASADMQTVTNGKTVIPRAVMASEGPVGVPAAHRSPGRFSGSAWLLMRGNGATSLASGGQLGGSQTGFRLFYTPGPRMLAITARVSTALAHPTGREAAIGIALRGRNAGLIAEQRIAIDGSGRSAPTLFGYGGVSDVTIVSGIVLDGYLQAGVVGVRNPAAFVDGAVRLERPVLSAQAASLSVGAGAWGGAQAGARRVDVGPQIVARFALARTNLRASAEWRQRVTGDAKPGSGPSVTVGFDF